MENQIEALLASLRQGAQSEAALPALNAEMAEAKALRGKPLASVDENTGYVSPFEAMTGMIQQGRGAQQRRQLAPQIAQANQQVAGSKAGMQEYTLRNAMDKVKTQKDQYSATALAKTRAAEEQRNQALLIQENNAINKADIAANKLEDDAVIAEKQQEYELAQIEANKKDPKVAQFGDFESYYDDDGNKVNVTRQGGKVYKHDANGDLVKTSMEGLNSEDDRLRGLGIDSNLIGKMDNKHKGIFIAADSGIKQVNRMNNLASKLTPEDVEMLNSQVSKLKEAAFDAITPNAFSTYIKEDMLGYSDAAKEYMRAVHELSAGIRHEKYGSALTAPEIAFSDLWLAGAAGLTGEQAMKRQRGYMDNMYGTVGSVDKLYGSNLQKRLTPLDSMNEFGATDEDAEIAQLEADLGITR